ncbi:SRPBCC family protein [Cohnella terricola]|uniref:SRPBCC domain-containing protein n=1 Tax=Cohnella terricola TaxID=1289167 RepID=A0A559JAJ3_9BACL|nr:SRPBCC domain-containing protein [Cohnella terricola]TVX96910.1 SRPBCC domain-containing protein [Cohnella terricola]
MAGSIFKQELKQATGSSWEEWIGKLDRNVDKLWSHEQIKRHIVEEYEVTDDWGEWIAVMYEQLMGRNPVGMTKDAGVQIGVRRTIDVPKEMAWDFLTSPQGLSLWIGEAPNFRLQAGHEYESKEGIFGKITVAVPYHKLRMTWQRPEWDAPSRLQLYVTSTNAGRTTVAIHQEMLEDVYMREVMRRHWEEMLKRFKNHMETALERL